MDTDEHAAPGGTAYWLLLVFALLVYLVAILVTFGQTYDTALDLHFAVRGFAGVLGALGILVGVARYRPRHCIPWILLAAMSALYAARPLLRFGILPYQDWLVLVIVLLQACAIVGALLAFAITRRALANSDVWLEASVVVLAVGAFHFHVSVSPGWGHGDSTFEKAAFALVAPLGYVVQSGLLVALLYSHHFRGLAARLVFLAVGLDIVVDGVGYLAYSESNALQVAIFDVAPLVSLTWMAAALHPSMLELDGGAANRSHGWNPASGATIGIAVVLPFLGVFFTGVISHGTVVVMLTLVGGAVALLVLRIRHTMDSLAAARAHSELRACTDPLTRLLNLRGLKQAIAARPGEAFILVYLDVDQFKLLNDLNGHAFGDDLLRQVAQRLTAAASDAVAVARIGGDEYAIVLSAREQDARRVVDIQSVFSQPFVIDGVSVRASASIGLARAELSQQAWASSAESPSKVLSEVMRLADMAQYQAKHEGGDRVVVYDEALELDLKRRALILGALKGDLDEVLELHYQAIVDIATGEVVGAEALCRMQHPQLGNVSPAEFIEIAEGHGHIHALGDWVFQHAVAELITAEVLLPERFSLSINLSPRQLRSPQFINELLMWADAHKSLIGHVRLEITEAALVDSEACERIGSLRESGYRIAIDDFGSRYASLSNLHRYRVDVLKLDREFVADIANDSMCKAVIMAVVQLAKVLKVDVISEGVETRQQAGILYSLGCEFGQGYLWHYPEAGLVTHVHTATSRTQLAASSHNGEDGDQ